MAVPLIVGLTAAVRVAGIAIRRWQTFLAAIGLIVTTGVTLSVMLDQAGKTALGLWPLLMMVFMFLLAKEFIRAWIKLRMAQQSTKGDR